MRSAGTAHPASGGQLWWLMTTFSAPVSRERENTSYARAGLRIVVVFVAFYFRFLKRP
jgi:hypothetical protein